MTLRQLLDRVTELDAMVASATTRSVKSSLEKLAERFLALADKQAAQLSGRDLQPATKSIEQWPGEPALRGGRHRLLNVLGSATGETAFVHRGQALPPAPRGFTWRFENLPLAFFGPAFEATPHPYLLLTPDLKIAGVNDAYLSATHTRRGDILGCFVFDVFPDNPDAPEANGVARLSDSLTHVLDDGRTHKMNLQRYDVRGPDGRFREKWWQPVNIPVFDDDRLIHVLHHVEDVTARHRSDQV